MQSIIAGLHPLERKVLPFLKEGLTVKGIARFSKLKEVEVMRALQWLENKKVLKIDSSITEEVQLDKNGIKYKEEGLPEIRLLKALSKPLKLSKAPLPKDEVNIAVGMLKKKAAIDIKKEGNDLILTRTAQGKKLLEKETLEETLLQKLPIEPSKLTPEEKFAYENLQKRKGVIKTVIIKTRTIKLTELGKELTSKEIKFENVIDKLTPKAMQNQLWKKKEFRAYDIKINVPKIFGGRKQHYRKYLEGIRKKFLSLGFKEMKGPIVESEFWDMDALFMPQFHSARDIHDAYYVKYPEYGKLDEALVKKVQASHENGFKTGSKGWGYKFDVKRTHRLLLRTQGTALSARMLADKKNLEIPGKYFAIARCFRYDVVDATHNSDFNQTEGIVLGEKLNFGHLKGLLKSFAEEFAETNRIKIKPAYFPFTEPSAELFAKHPEMGWIELGGSGIFRPEMTKPLGIDVPVIAWGMGIDRMAMFNMGIKDIRNLFSHDINFLRSIKCRQ